METNTYFKFTTTNLHSRSFNSSQKNQFKPKKTSIKVFSINERLCEFLLIDRLHGEHQTQATQCSIKNSWKGSTNARSQRFTRSKVFPEMRPVFEVRVRRAARKTKHEISKSKINVVSFSLAWLSSLHKISFEKRVHKAKRTNHRSKAFKGSDATEDERKVKFVLFDVKAEVGKEKVSSGLVSLPSAFCFDVKCFNFLKRPPKGIRWNSARFGDVRRRPKHIFLVDNKSQKLRRERKKFEQI